VTGVELESAAHKVPLSEPETDGTLAWSATTVVTVTARADGAAGLGWTYGPAAAASIVDDLFSPAIRDVDAFDIPGAHLAMRRATRNATHARAGHTGDLGRRRRPVVCGTPSSSPTTSPRTALSPRACRWPNAARSAGRTTARATA